MPDTPPGGVDVPGTPPGQQGGGSKQTPGTPSDPEDCNTNMYVDDTPAVVSGLQLDEVMAKAQQLTNNQVDWLEDNGMVV